MYSSSCGGVEWTAPGLIDVFGQTRKAGRGERYKGVVVGLVVACLRSPVGQELDTLVPGDRTVDGAQHELESTGDTVFTQAGKCLPKTLYLLIFQLACYDF